VRMPEGDKPQVKLRLLDGTEFPHLGFLNFEDMSIDVRTGTTEIRSEFPNPGNILKPGQFLRGSVVGWERPDVLTVPQRAVTQSQTGPFVYLVGAGNKAEMRPVKLGEWVMDDWIVLDGVEPGDRVIVDGIGKIGPGATVDPVPFGAAAPVMETTPAAAKAPST
ncbi:efflux RND transporter periplasmic adaptor subunit, partial [Candidatus Poribacteria bacterium]|nr:efflux RND transporter periplasmic adaptor subunit [Candidatus Poribacteria bacterium]